MNISEASQICWHFPGGILFALKGECGVNRTDLLLVSQSIDIEAGKNQCGFLRGGFRFDFQHWIWGFDEYRNAKWNRSVSADQAKQTSMNGSFQLSFLSAYTIC